MLFRIALSMKISSLVAFPLFPFLLFSILFSSSECIFLLFCQSVMPCYKTAWNTDPIDSVSTNGSCLNAQKRERDLLFLDVITVMVPGRKSWKLWLLVTPVQCVTLQAKKDPLSKPWQRPCFLQFQAGSRKCMPQAPGGVPCAAGCLHSACWVTGYTGRMWLERLNSQFSTELPSLLKWWETSCQQPYFSLQ